MTYGALAERAAAIDPPADPVPQAARTATLHRQSVSTLDQADKVVGRARYGIDFRLPGMKFATIRQCPMFGGVLSAVDEKPALALPGVRKSDPFERCGRGGGRYNISGAAGAAALDPRWTVANPVPDSAEISRRLTAGIDAVDAAVSPRQGGRKRAKLRVAYAALGAATKPAMKLPISRMRHWSR
jgi:isoquinoline 1-oxidoreductase beta subunit